MAKFSQGQVITYKQGIHRIRLVAKTGFEGYEEPTFYDLINVETKDKTVELVDDVDAVATLYQETVNAAK